MKPVSQPCLRNQEPIYQVISQYLKAPGCLLELACGTAQHAVYFSERLPHISWQASDKKEALIAANMWISECNNLNAPLAVDVSEPLWSRHLNQSFDYIYCANLIHFVKQDIVDNMFSGFHDILNQDGYVFFYGPFNQNGYTSEGNARLDAWLTSDIDPLAGIKELSDVLDLANKNGLEFIENHIMPANNHFLVFKKSTV